MKARELRIGNLVNVKYNEGFQAEKIDEIKIIEMSYVVSTENHRDLKKGRTQPIPLTEEWLIKFGLEYMEGWDDQTYYCCPKNQEFQIMQCINGYEYDYTILKYVHHLQNLYYALTGEELCLRG